MIRVIVVAARNINAATTRTRSFHDNYLYYFKRKILKKKIRGRVCFSLIRKFVKLVDVDMEVVADLQLHSKYSRAVSPQMTIPFIAQWAAKKGIGLVATGDWTHPLWFREIQANLEELGNGLLKIKNGKWEVGSKKLDHDVGSGIENTLFLLATEVSSIYSQGGKSRRVHTLVWVPSLAAAEKINQALRRRGCNLMADGRPIIGLSCIEVADLVLNIEPKALIIPAHAWTPWFSVFGGMSGFDSLEEAFGKFAKNVYAVETGLSSNPAMNWRIKELDNRSILSFSDAHSGPKLGREATVFELNKLSYNEIREAIIGKWEVGSGKLDNEMRFAPHISYTIEFYPEEGKYHYSGHRNCGVSFGPEETAKNKGICPVCGRSLTQGVMQRVEELASRSENDLQISNFKFQISNINSDIRMTRSKVFPKRPPFAMLVPLLEIIAESIGSPVSSPKVLLVYQNLITAFGGEFAVLLSTSIDEIKRIGGERVAEGISKVRLGEIEINPGYDGVFGKVKIWKEEVSAKDDEEQLTLFG